MKIEGIWATALKLVGVERGEESARGQEQEVAHGPQLDGSRAVDGWLANLFAQVRISPGAARQRGRGACAGSQAQAVRWA